MKLNKKNMPGFSFIPAIIAMLVMMVPISQADELLMQDGSRLMGKVIKKENGTLTFKTTYAGVLQIKWELVKELHTEQPVKIWTKNNDIFVTDNISIENKSIDIADKKSPSATAAADINFINPPDWKLGIGYRFRGILNLALKSQSGNTDKNEFDFDGQGAFRWKDDRVTLKGDMERDNNEGELSADNWTFSGKYDHFLTEKRYYGVFAKFEQDKFADLDLRTTLGPFMGQQFYETNDLNLSLELGLAWINEEYYEAENDDYIAGTWSIDYEQFFMDGLFQLYHNDSGRLNLENTNKFIFDSKTGIRVPLIAGIVGSAEIEAEYDSEPGDDADKRDTTFRLKLGYQW